MNPGLLSSKVSHILSNPANRILVSTVSFWEIAIKEALGRLQLIGYKPEDFSKASAEMGFEIMPLSADGASTFHHLTGNYHKDPFDRMLIWRPLQTIIPLSATMAR